MNEFNEIVGSYIEDFEEMEEKELLKYLAGELYSLLYKFGTRQTDGMFAPTFAILKILQGRKDILLDDELNNSFSESDPDEI